LRNGLLSQDINPIADSQSADPIVTHSTSSNNKSLQCSESSVGAPAARRTDHHLQKLTDFRMHSEFCFMSKLLESLLSRRDEAGHEAVEAYGTPNKRNCEDASSTWVNRRRCCSCRAHQGAGHLHPRQEAAQSSANPTLPPEHG
jgi:hypothetical protein